MRPVTISVLLLLLTLPAFCLVQGAVPEAGDGVPAIPPDATAPPVVPDPSTSSSPLAARAVDTSPPTIAGVPAPGGDPDGLGETAGGSTARPTTPRSTVTTDRPASPVITATIPATSTTTAAPTPVTSRVPTSATGTPLPPTGETTAATTTTPAPRSPVSTPLPPDAVTPPDGAETATLPATLPPETVIEERVETLDLDPGLPPYTGATPIQTDTTVSETSEPTPTFEPPAAIPNETAAEPPVTAPPATVDGIPSFTFELPPGAYEVEPVPTRTETAVPVSTAEPGEASGSSLPQRWLAYLLFVVLGIAGVAGVALIGSRLGRRRGAQGTPEPGLPGAPGSPPPGRTGVRSLLAGGYDLPEDEQVLIDRILAFAPGTMPVERLGRTLLDLEASARERARDSSLRLGRLIDLSGLPSLPVPDHAARWSRAHGFRVLSVDDTGMALLVPSLPGTSRTDLGVLPVEEMVEGTSPIPMTIPPAAQRS